MLNLHDYDPQFTIERIKITIKKYVFYKMNLLLSNGCKSYFYIGDQFHSNGEKIHNIFF